ncbi:uncharacterized protein MYCFIDRAFT_208655 [Pseudocercospora fijiensis CIRAD86]|uniref:Deoxyuridine 5'-triphosphate nucleotidohydrolase n=1 Tax=Pseudocercospora fijiensis (strain CIRAD86) TaxID=383855 RepID=M2YMQ1_PSEFD|nr:uncharacterized protein MYCFIDRAFT_208655 [Pseudocercospora fijiensis CIRAD86]EME79025.1 hypothetical protein MYCFIDRAFT_208655 [Pseudocercospora fijiensis CIRAD86]
MPLDMTRSTANALRREIAGNAAHVTSTLNHLTIAVKMAETPAPEHQVPSQPASPLPKRTKYTEPAANLTVASLTFPAMLNDQAPTPTPGTPNQNSLANPLSQMSGPTQATASYPPPAPGSTLPSMSMPMPPMGQMPQIPSMSFEPPPPALQVKLLSESAKPPTRGSEYAAGYDLYASKDAVVPAPSIKLIQASAVLDLTEDDFDFLTRAGVIDADYRGPVKVLLFNLSDVDFQVAVGERVAQLIIERIYTPQVLVVEQLEETVRGAGGFGSTGGFGGSLPPINHPSTAGARQPGKTAWMRSAEPSHLTNHTTFGKEWLPFRSLKKLNYQHRWKCSHTTAQAWPVRSGF